MIKLKKMDQLNDYHASCLKCSKEINGVVNLEFIKFSKERGCSVKAECEQCLKECSEHILYCDYCLKKVHSHDLKKCNIGTCNGFCCKKCMKRCFDCQELFVTCHMKFCSECYFTGYCNNCTYKNLVICDCFRLICENHRCLNCSSQFKKCFNCQKYCIYCNSQRIE